MMEPRTLGQSSKLDLRKRGTPIGRREKLHERMERELTNLKRDQRFWDGDLEYRAYVQRQFERVYNDPSGKPQSIRIGAPEIFATDIEPFKDARAVMSQREASVGRPKGRRTPKDISTSSSPSNRSIEYAGGIDTQHGASSLRTNPSMSATRRLNQTKRSTNRVAAGDLGDLVDVLTTGDGEPAERGMAKAQKLLEKFREKDWPTAEMLLEHYLQGTGEDVTLPSAFLQDYPTLRLGYRGVFRNVSRWFFGDLTDSRIGAAPLPIHDGDKVTIGSQSADDVFELNDFVMWESTFKGAGETLNPIDKLALDDEVHASIGGGTMQGFLTDLRLVREGNVIKVSGEMTFRVRDVYKFDSGHWLGFDEIESAGQAERFTLFSEPWTLEIEGIIMLRDGVPTDVKLMPVGLPGLGSQFPDVLQDPGFFTGP